ncbi:hypothetical protein QJS10_CPB12g00946 [Acorus calamus]|uniref:Uncharacterized protein n=1 Tax=Acorus calamus TaxID=4465 RepID=A0AAV9DKD3_ACOCL|nr:hypothetical protein QJS10_CPB12g00946 [Acorus calamus]
MMRPPKPTKPFSAITPKHRSAILASLLVIITTTLLFHSRKPKSNPQFTLPSPKWNAFQSSVDPRPTVDRINGTDSIWQVPTSPKAVLFIAHGCNGRAANFWDPSPRCPGCVGLPEERLIALQALDRRFAVLTVSSVGRCWSFGREEERVIGIIKNWVAKNTLGDLPIIALGASSGGYFVSSLAMKMKFSSVVIMIAEGVFDSIDVSGDYPPTLFVHMPKDRKRERLIRMNMEALRKKGVDIGEVRCEEFPLVPEFFSDRIPGLDRTVSVKLFEMLREKGFVDEKGYMRRDGRAIPWKEGVKGMNLTSGDGLDLYGHVQEEMNLAYAYHEMTSFPMEQILDWVESHIR